MTEVIVQGRRLARMRTGLTPTAAAVAAVAALSAVQAHAQQAQQVTVTGIRSAIESAISVKKNADGVTESLSAEDIGKLPDTTIAESLARRPGVTAQRTREGSASAISIRGLGPDFSGYLINGREQAGIGNSRALDHSVYPADLIGGATVSPTADAALIGGGLAGTIDQKLIDPTLYRNRVIAASRTKVRTGVGLDKDKEGTGSRTSLTYI
ncbi:MAG: TonB-dependent receptor plug domain-containing protein, partial [Betaproteobacteria bacterium]